ncbi:uncharacterized protein LY89DRAFT_757823 [Mollisia scopiformis]|uniref:Uncharacterized protein n=1 Tax=Mollisia scopiformis TaxID=149040 RepID=A0A194WWU3_MOLSC|nr:uncharacterized protein LY89DRAFT_757823 [Mollisia scopiformis]KUJ12154.1 hypothetical protein LY89DRAFT_757823 [Mollisia scopiformis]
MSSQPTTFFRWKDLPPELRGKVFDMIFEVLPGPQIPDNLEPFCELRVESNRDGDFAMTMYHEVNRIMTPSNMCEWREYNRSQLNRVQHLYLMFNQDTSSEDALLLDRNPLSQNNNLHSVIIDLTRIGYFSKYLVRNVWEDTLVPMIKLLILASHGCVNKISIVFTRPPGCRRRLVKRMLCENLSLRLDPDIWYLWLLSSEDVARTAQK